MQMSQNMEAEQDKQSEEKTINFQIDEVLQIKGLYFKIVLIDVFTGKLGLKRISKEEALFLKKDNT